MIQLAAQLLGPFDTPAMGLWIFLSVGAVCLFVVFLPLTTYMENRRKEREAFYKADMMRRMTEAPAESSRAAGISLLALPPRPVFFGVAIDGLVEAAMHAEVGLPIAFDVGRAHVNVFAHRRPLRDAGQDGLAVQFPDHRGQADIHGDEAQLHAQSFPKSFAVRSMASFAFATISSISASVMTSGGASTIVSRMARMMRPLSKQ